MKAEDHREQALSSKSASWEQHSFDDLAKGLASGTLSRRKASKFMGGTLLGGLLASIPGVAWATHNPGHESRRGGCPPGKTGVVPGVSLTAQKDKCSTPLPASASQYVLV